MHLNTSKWKSRESLRKKIAHEREGKEERREGEGEGRRGRGGEGIVEECVRGRNGKGEGKKGMCFMCKLSIYSAWL